LNYELQPIPSKQIILRTHFSCHALIGFDLLVANIRTNVLTYKWTSQAKEKILKMDEDEFLYPRNYKKLPLSLTISHFLYFLQLNL
jgi:hypothetical protein